MADTSFSRPNVAERDDGRWAYRASTLGSCERALVLEAMGQTPAPMPDHVQKGMDEGTANEQKILDDPRVEAANFTIAKDRAVYELFGGVTVAPTGGMQLYTELDCGKAGVVTCHPDAIAVHTQGEQIGQFRVVEVKFLRGGWPSPKTIDDFWAKNPKYAWQFAVQMHATGLKGLYLIGNKDDDGEIVDGVDGIRRVEIDEPPFTRAQIVKRLAALTRMVNEAVDGGAVPACDWRMYPCGFYQDHDGQKVWAGEDKPLLEVKGRAADEIRALAIAYEAAKAKEKQHKGEAEEIRDRLLELLGAAGDETGCVQYGGWEVQGVVDEVPASTREFKAYTRRYVKVKRMKSGGNDA